MRALKKEVSDYGVTIPDEEWEKMSSFIVKKFSRKKEVIFPQTETCKNVIFLIKGITASVYNYEGKELITRFFKDGNFSTNILSAVSKDIASDYLIAITDVEYYFIPFDFFLDSFLHSTTFGLFIRKKIIENSIENKKFTTLKTISDTRVKYQFMLDNYPTIIRNSPSKYMAKFLGITPEGYSRFLASRRNS